MSDYTVEAAPPNAALFHVRTKMPPAARGGAAHPPRLWWQAVVATRDAVRRAERGGPWDGIAEAAPPNIVLFFTREFRCSRGGYGDLRLWRPVTLGGSAVACATTSPG